jgi:hypothetical protein
MQNNQTTWTKRATFHSDDFSHASLAANGSMIVLATNSNYSPNLPIKLLYSTNGGDTWTESASNPGISSVAYGNNVFLGSGPNGLWKSTNGIDWQKISSTYFGDLIFSSNEKLFFSNIAGISKTGTEWVAYDRYNNDYSPPVSTNTGVVMVYDYQLSPIEIPSYSEKYYGIPRKAIVGKPFSFNISVNP